ncbi:MAG: heliorhodopsin HeR [Acidimicrobiia bacterium]
MPDAPMVDNLRMRRLRVFNVVVGLILAAEGALMLALSNGLSLPVFASYLRDDPVEMLGAAPADKLFSIDLGVMIAVFLFLAAADHLLVSAPRVNGWYVRQLDRRANYARWIEYSISSSIMIVLISMLSGIRDIAALTAIFGVNTAMILFGILMERQQEPGRADWSAFWFGTLAGAVPWIAIWTYILVADEVPGFVYAIITIELVLFFSFALNMVLQYRQVGRWRDYVAGEVTYIVLSLGAKSLLAWLVFANVLRS